MRLTIILLTFLGLIYFAENRIQAENKIQEVKKPSPESRLEILVSGKTVMTRPELEVVELTNRERRRHGLSPLRLDFSLVNTSRRHCIWMARNHNLQHGNDPVAENIAMGQMSSTGVIQSWMNSQGHRANMLNPGNSRIGTAAVRATNGTLFWIQQFLR